MNKIICDKCGKEVTGKKYLVSIMKRNILFPPDTKVIDLCDECAKELLKYRVEE